jgi:LmbE family N-acetylglucosaminyl deacetylase
MSDTPAVLAIGAHPDDIEFSMAGTLMMLRDRGWNIHYLNIANGNCGTAVDDSATIIRKRTAEAREACDLIGAVWHPPLCNDLDILYRNDLIAKLVSIIRQVRPAIVLTQSPEDYMEDHMNACRMAVTAAFCRGMLNVRCDPYVTPASDDVTVYHALPHGLRGPLRKRIRPGEYVNVTPVIESKWDMLACHRSQKEWLDESQGMDAYLETMKDFAKLVGEMSGRFDYAEGWRRRSHLGFSAQDRDILAEVLGDQCLIDQDYEAWLDE